MADSQTPSTSMRRQPQQKRSKERVERILDAAAEIFAEIGYEAATTHAIAARAETAIGSLYQFFPDKLAIFHALELRHMERAREMGSKLYTKEMAKLPWEQLIDKILKTTTELIEQPTSRVVFLQYFVAPHMFESIDESFTWEFIRLFANLLSWRNPSLSRDKCELLAEVCVNCGNTLLVIGLRSDETHRKKLYKEIKDMFLAYLHPHVGDEILPGKVMKVMKCPRCHSQRISKNGRRHGKQRYICKDCRRQFLETKELKK